MGLALLKVALLNIRSLNESLVCKIYIISKVIIVSLIMILKPQKWVGRELHHNLSFVFRCCYLLLYEGILSGDKINWIVARLLNQFLLKCPLCSTVLELIMEVLRYLIQSNIVVHLIGQFMNRLNRSLRLSVLIYLINTFCTVIRLIATIRNIFKPFKETWIRIAW